LDEIAKEPYLDRLHCEFRDEFLSFTRSRGIDLNAIVRSEREDWVLELISKSQGVSVLPLSSATATSVAHRQIADMTSVRTVELVVTADTPRLPAQRAFLDAAKSFCWN